MKCSSFSSPEKRPHSDACALPFTRDESGVIIPLFDDPPLFKACHRLLESKDFRAKEGEVVVLYPDPVAEARFVAVGMGEKKRITSESITTSFASLSSLLRKKQVSRLTVLPPVVESLPPKTVLKSLLQGLYFGSYTFQAYRSPKEEDGPGISEVSILTDTPHLFVEIENDVKSTMAAVAFARDLVNRNADEITPEGFAAVALSLATADLHIAVHGKEWIEQEHMNLLLAVARGARYEPRFVIAKWQGAPKDPDTTVLVGKGITFDTGGLDIKTDVQMQKQKADMAGAAAVLGVMQAVRDFRLPLNVSAVIPLCENSVSANSYKPGDVYTARSGKTVEIAHTDAEGRLILADALHYASNELSASRIIDVATLTGSAEVALGGDISAFFSNTDSLAFLLERASHHSGDPMWRMPLYFPYMKLLDSDIADCKNVGTRVGGAINAALFLSSFVGTIPWAHIDIAGTAFPNDQFRYYGKGATGVPVRMLLEFLRSLIPGIIPEIEPEEGQEN